MYEWVGLSSKNQKHRTELFGTVSRLSYYLMVLIVELSCFRYLIYKY